ncbi:MAG TPA: hypothetical protein PL181_17065 [bacterium]|nr:hypothetical protein [bacterium]
MKLGEEKILGRRWVSGYRCPCGKLFEAFRVGYHAVIPVPDVCPLCGEPGRDFEEGSILLEDYTVREKLGWFFRYTAELSRSIEFKPFPAEYDNGIPVITKQQLASAKIVRLT